MQESSWATPSPTNEAKWMLGLAQLIGTDAVRNLIAVSDKEKAKLREWAQLEPLLAQRIEDCIRFRERVLLLFEQFLQREEEKQRAA